MYVQIPAEMAFFWTYVPCCSLIMFEQWQQWRSGNVSVLEPQTNSILTFIPCELSAYSWTAMLVCRVSAVSPESLHKVNVPQTLDWLCWNLKLCSVLIYFTGSQSEWGEFTGAKQSSLCWKACRPFSVVYIKPQAKFLCHMWKISNLVYLLLLPDSPQFVSTVRTLMRLHITANS